MVEVTTTPPEEDLEAMEESSIESLNRTGSDHANPSEMVVQDWEQLRTILPTDLDASAEATRALLRRREVRQASDLLRLILVYAVCDWSLRVVGAWAAVIGLATLSDVALVKRLRNSKAWVGHLIVDVLARRMVLRPQAGVRLRIVDATVITQPGSRGVDWRVHLSLDLGSMCLDGIEVTDAKGGETLARFPSQAGDIRVADRGFAFASGIGAVLADQASIVVRIRWQNLPLQDEQGQRFDIVSWLQDSFRPPVKSPHSVQLWLPTPQGRFAVRLLAASLPLEATERARRRAREQAAKKGYTPDERTLIVAGYILILTNLPSEQWSTEQVLDLYRVRWQIEMHIKRLKSLLVLDGLRAHEPRLAQTYLLAKLLAALLLEQLTTASIQRIPDWLASLYRPLSPWRLATLAWEHLRSVLRGPLLWSTFLDKLPMLQRFLCDSPRKRRQQLASARALLSLLSGC